MFDQSHLTPSALRVPSRWEKKQSFRHQPDFYPFNPNIKSICLIPMNAGRLKEDYYTPADLSIFVLWRPYFFHMFYRQLMVPSHDFQYQPGKKFLSKPQFHFKQSFFYYNNKFNTVFRH